MLFKNGLKITITCLLKLLKQIFWNMQRKLNKFLVGTNSLEFLLLYFFFHNGPSGRSSGPWARKLVPKSFLAPKSPSSKVLFWEHLVPTQTTKSTHRFTYPALFSKYGLNLYPKNNQIFCVPFVFWEVRSQFFPWAQSEPRRAHRT